jgi:hypothetical protein
MDRNLEHLLQPTLSNEEQRVPIFSARACFFTAFLGGPIAITLLSALNSDKLKSLKNDLKFYFLGAFVYLVYLFIVLDIPEGANVSEWMNIQRRENMFYRYGSRGMALTYWAVYYYLHKQFYKTMDIFDIVPPNPWKTTIICILLGGFGQFLLAMLVLISGGVI